MTTATTRKAKNEFKLLTDSCGPSLNVGFPVILFTHITVLYSYTRILDKYNCNIVENRH